MSREVEFVFPAGMEFVDIAKTFTAYLQGSLAFQNQNHDQGPIRKENGDYWQLDASNDYFFEVRSYTESKGEIRCRYTSQYPIIKAMVELFRLRYMR